MIRLQEIYKNNFEFTGSVLDLERNEIRLKGVEFHQRKNDFAIAFPCSNIKEQDELDYLNAEYGITVHFGTKKGYQIPVYDISKCNIVNNSKDPNATRCYFSCDRLTEEDAVKIYSFLIRNRY